MGAAADGSWGLGRTDFADALSFLPSNQDAGNYRILWIGDPRAVPQPGWKLADGVAYALSDSGAPDIRDTWTGEATRSELLVADALRLATSGESARLGRMVAPMSVRYIVLPLRAGPQASGATAYPPPPTLLNTLTGQLDLRQKDIDDALVVYENEAWIPERAVLSAPAAAASQQAGFESLVRTDVAGAAPVLPDADGANRWRGDLAPGVTYLSAPANDRWHLAVDGTTMARRPAFGWANAFDVTKAGTATLAYDTPITRLIAVLLQAVLWIGAIAVALQRGHRRRRSGERARHPAAHVLQPTTPGESSAIIDLTHEPSPDAMA